MYYITINVKMIAQLKLPTVYIALPTLVLTHLQ